MARESSEVWARRVARWKASGLSCDAFADQEGVKASTLSWWRYELGRRAKASSARRRTKVKFVEIDSAAVVQAQERVEVSLQNGRVVRVPSMFDDAHLVRVLAVAERQ